MNNCSIKNDSSSSTSSKVSPTPSVTESDLIISCRYGDSGGLKQSFYLEVYNEEGVLFGNYSSSERTIVDHRYRHEASSANPDPGHQNDHHQGDYVMFSIPSLPPEHQYTIRVFSSNGRGRSEPAVVSIPSSSLLNSSQKQTHGMS